MCHDGITATNEPRTALRYQRDTGTEEFEFREDAREESIEEDREVLAGKLGTSPQNVIIEMFVEKFANTFVSENFSKFAKTSENDA